MKFSTNEYGLLQCSRINVLDIRPVMRSDNIPFESIKIELSDLDQNQSLLIILPQWSKKLEDYFQAFNFDIYQHKISEDLYWLLAYRSNQNSPAQLNGDCKNLSIVPGGETGYVYVLDCRSRNDIGEFDCLDNLTKQCSVHDTIVLHSKTSYEDLPDDPVQNEDCRIKSTEIDKNHYRTEINFPS